MTAALHVTATGSGRPRTCAPRATPSVCLTQSCRWRSSACSPRSRPRGPYAELLEPLSFFTTFLPAAPAPQWGRSTLRKLRAGSPPVEPCSSSVQSGFFWTCRGVTSARPLRSWRIRDDQAGRPRRKGSHSRHSTWTASQRGHATKPHCPAENHAARVARVWRTLGSTSVGWSSGRSHERKVEREGAGGKITDTTHGDPPSSTSPQPREPSGTDRSRPAVPAPGLEPLGEPPRPVPGGHGPHHVALRPAPPGARHRGQPLHRDRHLRPRPPGLLRRSRPGAPWHLARAASRAQAPRPGRHGPGAALRRLAYSWAPPPSSTSSWVRSSRTGPSSAWSPCSSASPATS